MNQVFYRKYRPKSFSEVIGQEHVVQTLTNALKSGAVSHGYLFSGPRGSGKTTLARLLAKSVNCSNRGSTGSPEPCNQCDSCREINEGRNIDLTEIDAASHRGIDEIRELKEGIKFSPTKSKYKVFIIDESHQLTKEAANALLKTLEEPPAHAIFILATTELHKMIPTIVSRCQHFEFRRLKLAEIIQRLRFIAGKEGIKIDPAALEMIALSSGGSFRDAEGLLDQAAAFSGQADKKETTISAEDLRELMGVVEVQKISRLMDRLAEKNAAQAIILLNAAFDQGADLSQLVIGLIGHLHATLMYKIGGEQLHDPLSDGLTDEEFQKLKERAGKFPEEELRRLINLLLEAQQQMKSSPIIQLPLELAFAEFCGI
ncbi:MAG: DNA polymerase III subunit gamma/tau [Candidatus Nealsonbacteria bacterium]|nr:DNA polymerase III subunit gamma/tau [Candidatus Nealsonbacteria bacterium]